jgi:hypothetical protein
MACWLIKDRNNVTSRVTLNVRISNALKRKLVCLNYQNCLNDKKYLKYKKTVVSLFRIKKLEHALK